MPLSGNEDAAVCGRHAEAYPDPGQYAVTVKPMLSFFGQATSIKVATELRSELSELGYEIRETPNRL